MHLRVFIFVLVCAFCAPVSLVYAAAAEVPITDEAGGILGNERNTCDPAFREVMDNRAWMEAQREVTQTQNLIKRPDSVLGLSCFNQFLNQQSFYAARNFPGDPQDSDSDIFGGVIVDLAVVFPDEFISGFDPGQTNGYVMFGILEILVMDQLNQVNSATGLVRDNDPANILNNVIACGGQKDTYLDDNFPGLFLGNRANTSGGNTALSAGFPNDVSDALGYACTTMNDVWSRAKCYDFATESALYEDPPVPSDHDGFYSLQEYIDLASANGDFRTQASACPAPDATVFDIGDFGDPLEVACNTAVHGIPALPNPFALTAGAATIWATADTGSNVDLGLPGAAEGVLGHFDLITGTCSDPIQTGYLVDRDGSIYIDAICPEPGCIFEPPSSIAGLGTCELPP